MFIVIIYQEVESYLCDSNILAMPTIYLSCQMLGKCEWKNG